MSGHKCADTRLADQARDALAAATRDAAALADVLATAAHAEAHASALLIRLGRDVERLMSTEHAAIVRQRAELAQGRRRFESLGDRIAEARAGGPADRLRVAAVISAEAAQISADVRRLAAELHATAATIGSGLLRAMAAADRAAAVLQLQRTEAVALEAELVQRLTPGGFGSLTWVREPALALRDRLSALQHGDARPEDLAACRAELSTLIETARTMDRHDLERREVVARFDEAVRSAIGARATLLPGPPEEVRTQALRFAHEAQEGLLLMCGHVDWGREFFIEMSSPVGQQAGEFAVAPRAGCGDDLAPVIAAARRLGLIIQSVHQIGPDGRLDAVHVADASSEDIQVAARPIERERMR